MDWISQNQFFIFAVVSVIGFIAIGWLISDTRKKLRAILGASNGSEENLSRDLLRRAARTETLLEALEPRLKTTEEICTMSIHKVGFLRFNPFQDTGGDNSFVLVLLDRNNDGVIISSLYMREAARLYGKQIERGISRQQLSEEEKNVLENTMQKN